MEQDLTEEIEARRGLLYAHETPRGGDSFLIVYRSIQVREDGKLFSKVRERLRQYCHVILDDKEECIPGMIARTTYIKSYLLLEKCPGDREHECAVPTLAVAGNRMYLLDRDGIRASVHSFQVAMP